jgi:hypothetical protein
MLRVSGAAPKRGITIAGATMKQFGEFPDTAAPTMTDVDLMALIIVETWGQERCAQFLADDFPDASRDDVLTAIDETEPVFLSMGFDGLSQLRKEVERVHPAWKD